MLCTKQVGKWLFYRQNNMFITCPCCSFLLLTLYPSRPTWVIKHAGLIHGKAKDFHPSVMFHSPFHYSTEKREGNVGHSYFSWPTSLFPAASEIGAINTQGEFKESPLVLLSICKIITEPSHFYRVIVVALNKHTAI